MSLSMFRPLIFNCIQSFRAGRQIENVSGIGALGVLLRTDTMAHESWPWSGWVVCA